MKLLVNIVNHWLEHKRQNQLLLAAKDDKFIQAAIESQAGNSKDPFVKATRRVLFLSITLTMCYLMIFYASNPDIKYTVLLPQDGDSTGGILSWFTGSDSWVVVELTGGLLLKSFMDLCFMIVGFYAVPSKLR